MAREIPLTQGKVALVDDADYERVSQHKWHAYCPNRSRGATKYYASTVTYDANGKKKIVQMTRFICGAPSGVEIDHENHDTLDNRRSNLRHATRLQNSHNSSLRKNNTSGFKGAFYDVVSKRWKAKTSCAGKQINIGYFDSAEEDARAYDAKAIELFGEFAKLNFPLGDLLTVEPF